MDAVIIEIKDKKDAQFWLNLAKRTGNRAKSISTREMEDAGLSLLIKEGMETDDVSRESVMEALGK
jgi:hypothetical protein